MTPGAWVMAIPSIDVTQFDADLQAAINDLPATFSWSTYSLVPCTCTQLAEGYLLTTAGNIDEVHFEILFANSSTSLNPQPGDRVSVTQFGSMTAMNYEVLSSETSQDGISVTLIVKADHRA